MNKQNLKINLYIIISTALLLGIIVIALIVLFAGNTATNQNIVRINMINLLLLVSLFMFMSLLRFEKRKRKNRYGMSLTGAVIASVFLIIVFIDFLLK